MDSKTQIRGEIRMRRDRITSWPNSIWARAGLTLSCVQITVRSWKDDGIDIKQLGMFRSAMSCLGLRMQDGPGYHHRKQAVEAVPCQVTHLQTRMQDQTEPTLW